MTRARGFLFLAALLMSGLVVAGCSNDGKSPQAERQGVNYSEMLQKGVDSLKRGDLDSAIEWFGTILEKAPIDAPERSRADVYLGQIAYRAGNMDLAQRHLAAAIKADPSLYPVELTLGNALFSGGKLDQAIVIWEHLVKGHPELASAHNNLGVAYLDKGDFDKAILHLEKTIALTPNNAKAHENLAIAFGKKGMGEEAERARHKAKTLREQFAGQADAPAPGAADTP
ncbi:MAG: tetratricopeptide repeat protein [Leptospirillia bacterium]